jgi:hypothetical protein
MWVGAARASTAGPWGGAPLAAGYLPPREGQVEAIEALLRAESEAGLVADATIPRVAEAEILAGMVAPETLGSGDAAFEELGARVTCHGMLGRSRGDGASRPRLRALEIDLHHAGCREGSGPDYVHHFWRYEDYGVLNVSPPCSTSLPVASGRGLDLEISLVGEAGARVRQHLALSTGREAGAAKLRTGVYVLTASEGARVFVSADYASRQGASPQSGQG